MDRVWIGLGALAGVSAVAMAAVAAHGLDAQAVGMVQQAVQMQGWHALALLFCGVWARRGGVFAHLAGAAFAVGLLLFCGAVYLLALAGIRLPMVAPTGGTVLMLGWVFVGVSALRWNRGEG